MPITALRNSLQARKSVLGLLFSAVQKGDWVPVPMIGKQCYVASSPAAIQRVLIERAHAYSRRDNLEVPYFRQVLGDGMLTTDDQVWLRLRRMHARPFSEQQVALLARKISERTDQVLESWDCWRPRREHEDFFPRLIALTSAISVDCFFSYELQESTALELARALMDGQDFVFQGLLSAIRTPLWMPVGYVRRYHKAIRTVDRISQEILEARSRQDHGDLLSGLLAQKLSDRELRDQVVTAFTAAPENMATALTWSIHQTLQDPTWAQRLRDEPPGEEQPVFEAFLREILRMYPGAPVLTRLALEDDVVDGHALPAGSYVILSPYAIHRNPRFWSEAERFWPERPEYERTRAGDDRYRYIPFGAGPRRCIGDHFAQLLLGIVLPRLLRRYEFEAKPGFVARPAPRINLRPERGLMLRVSTR